MIGRDEAFEGVPRADDIRAENQSFSLKKYTRFALMAVFRVNTIEIRISYSDNVDSKTAISVKRVYF